MKQCDVRGPQSGGVPSPCSHRCSIVAVIAIIPVIGRIIDTYSYPAAYRTASVLVLIGLGAFLYFDRRWGTTA